MLPVKSNNHQPKNTRAQSRKKRNQTVNAKVQVGTKTNKSKNKKKDDSICANQLSDTTQSGEPTLHTGMINRKGHQTQDTKTTMKKINFENKPIIKDLAKRINTFPKQYAPEYFTNILEYMIEKEIKATMCPTVQKINKWRAYVDRQREIQAQVRIQFLKTTSRIITGRKKMKQEMKKQGKKQNCNQSQSLSYENKCSLNSDSFQSKEYKSDESQSSHSSSLGNASCPQIPIGINFPKSQTFTQKSLQTQWQQRYDHFTFLIQTIHQHLCQQSPNTIYPTCYIFYMLTIADSKVFSFLKQHEKNQQYSQQHQQSKSWISDSINKSYSRQPSAMDMIQYYMIISILIATKYHEIYPASLVELIDCVNYQLDYDYAIKIQGQVLDMLNFAEFYTDNQHKFLKMFITIVGWTSTQQNVCEFILQSGLNNPNLYLYSPLYKAAVVIGLHQQHIFNTQQKTMMIKSLCPGLSLDLMTKIKNEYLLIIIYNNKNKITSHKRKYFIFENEMKKILKGYTEI